MYDAENRRFVALDPIMDGSVYDISERVTDPMMFAQYLYVKDNPLRWIDPLGLKYTLIEGTIAHIEISAYIKFLYPTVKVGPTIYGLTRTKSGRGYADIVHPTSSGVDVYEIKSEQYASWSLTGKKYSTTGINQLESYIKAINEHPELNPGYNEAKKGTRILSSSSEGNPTILPYLMDTSKVIAVYTNYQVAPGMIFYEIRKKKDKDEEVLVSDEIFITEEDRDRIFFYYEEYVCPGMPSWDRTFIDIDTQDDYELNTDVLNWLESVTLSKVKNGYFTYARLSFPDGTTFYRCLGLGPEWMHTVWKPTCYELFELYKAKDQAIALDSRGNRWTPSPTAHIDFSSIPIIPMGSPALVPAF